MQNAFQMNSQGGNVEFPLDYGFRIILQVKTIPIVNCQHCLTLGVAGWLSG